MYRSRSHGLTDDFHNAVREAKRNRVVWYNTGLRYANAIDAMYPHWIADRYVAEMVNDRRIHRIIAVVTVVAAYVLIAIPNPGILWFVWLVPAVAYLAQAIYAPIMTRRMRMFRKVQHAYDARFQPANTSGVTA